MRKDKKEIKKENLILEFKSGWKKELIWAILAFTVGFILTPLSEPVLKTLQDYGFGNVSIFVKSNNFETNQFVPEYLVEKEDVLASSEEIIKASVLLSGQIPIIVKNNYRNKDIEVSNINLTTFSYFDEDEGIKIQNDFNLPLDGNNTSRFMYYIKPQDSMQSSLSLRDARINSLNLDKVKLLESYKDPYNTLGIVKDTLIFCVSFKIEDINILFFYGRTIEKAKDSDTSIHNYLVNRWGKLYGKNGELYYVINDGNIENVKLSELKRKSKIFKYTDNLLVPTSIFNR